VSEKIVFQLAPYLAGHTRTTETLNPEPRDTTHPKDSETLMLKKIRLLLIGLLMGFSLTATPAIAATPSGWRTYTNFRWGYRIEVPNSLVAQPEPENGGGLEFISTDGQVALLTYGQWDMDLGEVSLAESQRDNEWGWIGTKGRITYRSRGKTWFVISGISEKGRIFYQRHDRIQLAGSACFMTFSISYPQKFKKQWNPQTERIARSFRTPKGTCD
jgi:hypothetical protein